METISERTQMLELADKDFKAIIILMLKEVKENMLAMMKQLEIVHQ